MAGLFGENVDLNLGWVLGTLQAHTGGHAGAEALLTMPALYRHLLTPCDMAAESSQLPPRLERLKPITVSSEDLWAALQPPLP